MKLSVITASKDGDFYAIGGHVENLSKLSEATDASCYDSTDLKAAVLISYESKANMKVVMVSHAGAVKITGVHDVKIVKEHLLIAVLETSSDATAIYLMSSDATSQKASIMKLAKPGLSNM